MVFDGIGGIRLGKTLSSTGGTIPSGLLVKLNSAFLEWLSSSSLVVVEIKWSGIIPINQWFNVLVEQLRGH